MTGQFHGQLSLAVFGGLQTETAGRKDVFQAHSGHPLFAHIANPPDFVREIGVCKGRFGGDLIGGYRCRAKRQFDHLGRHGHGGKAHFAIPTVKGFQLLCVVGNVVHVLPIIGVGSDAGSLNAARGGANDSAVSRGGRGSRVKSIQNHTSAPLNIFERGRCNFCKSLCHFCFPPLRCEKFGGNVQKPSLYGVVVVWNRPKERGATGKPDCAAVNGKHYTVKPDSISDFRRLFGGDGFRFGLVPDVRRQVYGGIVKRSHRKIVSNARKSCILRDGSLRVRRNPEAVVKFVQGLFWCHFGNSHLSAVTWHMSSVLNSGDCLSSPLLVARKIAPSFERLNAS
uniref:Uncharacterized protein n=1 Tax=Siphoviridae sp. ctqED62 TaxID=2826468 RepID=A0A8S5MQX2_9CAUD|nr:MAG TPA: hypothetical protein [Siphoviridae sp. ctqED62]